jgi:serine/threonine protein kinase
VSAAGCLLILVALVIAIVLARRKKTPASKGQEIEMMNVKLSAPAQLDRTPYSVAPSLQSQSGLDISADWVIESSEVQTIKELGKGAFGVVWLSQWRGSKVALKVIRSDLLIEPEHFQKFQLEADVMKNLRPHPGVLAFLGVILNPLAIVTEYMEGGSLVDYLHSGKPIDEFKIVQGIVSGMMHLHSESVVHRDLAARNVLLSKELEPKISDFGMSRLIVSDIKNSTKSNTGPLKWMPPEALGQRIYSWYTDVWSFGILIYEIYERKTPYPDLENFQAAMKVLNEGLTLSIPNNCPPTVASIMTQCFTKDPLKRPPFAVIHQTLFQHNQQSEQ